MKTKILFVERKPSTAVSIEKVFRQVAKSLSKEKFQTAFQSLEYPNNLVGTIKNLLLYRRKEADIFHVTGHIHYIALILPKKNTVLTIHDVGILHIRKGVRRYILKKLLIDLPVRKLRYITAVSSFTKEEIVFYTKCRPEKIRVIENPLQEQFYAEEKKTFNQSCPIILQIGTTANKNIENLIKAIEGINCRLKIIGDLSIETEKLLKSKKIEYENKSQLNDFEIIKEYAESDIVAFCSTFEGFGLPIIEAQAMLTPVVTSNISPLKEVAGEAAELVDPRDYQSIRRGILKIIGDEDFRGKLVKKGIENVRRFKSGKIAREYESLYREIISGINHTQKSLE